MTAMGGRVRLAPMIQIIDLHGALPNKNMNQGSAPVGDGPSKLQFPSSLEVQLPKKLAQNS